MNSFDRTIFPDSAGWSLTKPPTFHHIHPANFCSDHYYRMLLKEKQWTIDIRSLLSCSEAKYSKCLLTFDKNLATSDLERNAPILRLLTIIIQRFTRNTKLRKYPSVTLSKKCIILQRVSPMYLYYYWVYFKLIKVPISLRLARSCVC